MAAGSAADDPRGAVAARGRTSLGSLGPVPWGSPPSPGTRGGQPAHPLVAAGGLLAEGDPEGGPGAVAALQHLSLLGGVDKPVAGGARTRSVGGQLLLKPLTCSTPPLESVLHC